MCGIAGLFDLAGHREPDRGRLQRMMDALEHRGPDGEGMWVRPGIALGHRRLAIIDIKGGEQPFVSASSETVVTYNGEIYNFRDLARDLERTGHEFRTRSDTEVLAELIERDGPDALPALQGMFAFAAWDRRRDTLLLARDRLGEKPLYFGISPDDWLVFASEMDAVLASGILPATIDPTAVSDYLFYGYVPDPKTIYRGISKLGAGTSLLCRRRERALQPQRWWRPRFDADGDLPFEEATEELRSQLDRAVGAQMVSDRPIGAFLSGGVDSGAVVGAMSDHQRDPITTCTIGFDDPAADERALARRVAGRYGTDHHETEVSFDAAELIPAIAAVYGEPFADSSALPMLLLCRMTRQHTVVALSGDGGDEVFAGYGRYDGFLRESRLRNLVPPVARSAIVARAGRLYPHLPGAPRPLRLKTALQSIGEDEADGYARAVSAVLPHRCDVLLAPALRDYRPQSVVRAAFAAAVSDDPVSRAQYADLSTWLPGRMLPKVDRAAMAFGLEVRPPLLDHRLVEWAGRLPRGHKLADGRGKRVLKAALEGRLPAEVLDGRKKGFGAPLRHWFRQPGSGLVERLLLRTSWRDSGFFDVDEVVRTAEHARSGGAVDVQELWSILMFDAFLDRNRADRVLLRY
jgi:asparagine synthase (glutamine-hydrolysing)